MVRGVILQVPPMDPSGPTEALGGWSCFAGPHELPCCGTGAESWRNRGGV